MKRVLFVILVVFLLDDIVLEIFLENFLSEEMVSSSKLLKYVLALSGKKNGTSSIICTSVHFIVYDCSLHCHKPVLNIFVMTSFRVIVLDLITVDLGAASTLFAFLIPYLNHFTINNSTTS